MGKEEQKNIEPILLTRRQVAEMVGVSEQTIRRMRARGDIPQPVGWNCGARRWHRPTVERWLRERSEEGQRHRQG